MSRSNGNGRRSGRRTTLTLFQRVLILSASLPIFRASGHITLDGDDLVVSVHDANDDAHVLTQSDPAKRCAAPAAHADFAGQLCLSFTGVEWYQSNRASTTWSELHAGGVEMWSVGAYTTDTSYRPLWSTTLNSNVRGANVLLRSGVAFTEVGRSGGNVIPFGATSQIGLPASDTPMWHRWGHSTASTPDFYHQRSGASAVTRDYASAPDAVGTAPTYTLKLGDVTSIIGRVREMFSLPILDAMGVALVHQYIQQTDGIAA